jgi:hypothetical protein
MRWTLGCLFASALALAGTGAALAVPMNLLTNPGFETGNFTGWTVGGTTPVSGVGTDGQAVALVGCGGCFLPASVNVRSGNNAAFYQGRGDPSLVITLSQTIAVNPAKTSAWASGLVTPREPHWALGLTPHGP